MSATIEVRRQSSRQSVAVLRGTRLERLDLPSPMAEVVRGVRWGRFDDFFTPAFWVARSWIDGPRSPMAQYAIGRSLREEVAACLLGGHGMPAEVGIAAFRRLRDRGLLIGVGDRAAIEEALCEPMEIGGRRVRYRYPRTKAEFVASALRKLEAETAPTHSAIMLRNWLMTFSGVGYKTASWITRNVTHSDEVAILDIHIVRAGLLMGLFSPDCSVHRDYLEMEEQLVDFAQAAGLRLSTFDSVIWCYMRQFGTMALEVLRNTAESGQARASGPRLTRIQ